MMLELILESLSALLIAGIIFYLAINFRQTSLVGKPGTRLILIGFILLLFGACIDITDEYPQLNYLIILGDTPMQSLLEKFFGRLLGSLFVLLGIMRILPVFVELREKQRLIETIIATIPAPTFCKDNMGRYLACNRAFEELFGYSQQQIIGQTVFALAPKELAAIYQRADEELLANNQKQTYETRITTADGESRDVLFHKAVFHKEDGTAGGIVGVMLDISEQKRVEEALRQLDRMKSEFISTAAHELRTPLTSVQGYTELLLDVDCAGDFNEEQKYEFLREICQSCDNLSALIDELLDVGRIESGHPLQLNIHPRHPGQLLQTVVKAFRQQSPTRRIGIALELPPQRRVLYDEQRLRQLVENLLSNAIKYSPAGSEIEIDGRIIEERFQLQFRDKGIGMTATQLERIFDKFYRVDPTTNNVSGLGLGMSIVGNIVDAHQGQIVVESQLGKGTSVRVCLPLGSSVA